MKVLVEMEEADAKTVGMTLRSLAVTRLADASATERLERVGALMVAAKAPSADERAAILSMLGELVADDRAYWQDDMAIAAVCRLAGITIRDVLAFADRFMEDHVHV